MQIRRTNWGLIPLILLACLGSGMLPIATSGQSLEKICANIHEDRSLAMQQKQWGLLVSKAREFMSTCLTVDGGAEAEASNLFEMGFGLKKQGKFADAVPIWKRCVKIKPDAAECWDYLAEALDKQGEFEDVVPTLNRCVTINPDAAGCWVDLGIALDRAGRTSEAKKAYEQTISIGGYTEENAASVELARLCLSHPQTAATFRGHRLGESWQSFIRTEGGLCKIKINTDRCSEAASGEEATLSQHAKDAVVIFGFEYGRLARVVASMTGPAFAELTYFEKTYGKPYDKDSHPEEGTAESLWKFSDGGLAHAKEFKAKSGEFRIIFTITASDSTLRPGPLASNSQTPVFNGQTLGESWQKFAQTGGGLCQVSEVTAQECKNAAAGKFASLVQFGEDALETSFTFELGRLTQAELNTRVPKFVELDYLDQTYGHPYIETNNSEGGDATRRWDYADGGQVLAIERPEGQGFVITISAKNIPLQ
jgi:tetratricopeptide (TPR) repeat protein